MARVAAIQAAKRTAELIPLCHPLPLTRVAVDFTIDRAAGAVAIEVVAETRGQTGVEMEALTAAAVGLLTIYDMCNRRTGHAHRWRPGLLEKSGGKSGRFVAASAAAGGPCLRRVGRLSGRTAATTGTRHSFVDVAADAMGTARACRQPHQSGRIEPLERHPPRNVGIQRRRRHRSRSPE